MNVDQFDDMKQFIDSRVSQSEAHLGQRIDGVENKLEALEKKMDDGFAGVGEAVGRTNDRLDEFMKTDQQLDQRVAHLEQQTA